MTTASVSQNLVKAKHYLYIKQIWCSTSLVWELYHVNKFCSIQYYTMCPTHEKVLLSGGVHSIINVGILSSGILLTWPYNCSLFFCMMSMMSCFPFTPMISFVCSFFLLSIQEKRGWKEYKQPWKQGIWNQINGETEKNGVWFPEDGGNCYETG